MSNAMGLIGRKVGMTQIFTAEGDAIGVTVVELGPCPVLQIKSTDSKDGYDAIQLGYGTRKESHTTKALKGHFTKAGAALVRRTGEVRVGKPTLAKLSLGQILTVSDVFAEGDTIDVIATSKGRGFAGVMKRHNFRGFERTHGSHEYFRHGGSIGTRLTPGFTFKGKHMPGHMGAAQVTVQNIRVARVDVARNLVFLRGGVPGPNGGYVTVRHSVKSPKRG